MWSSGWLGSSRVNLVRKARLKRIVHNPWEAMVEGTSLGRPAQQIKFFGMAGLKAHPPEGLFSPGRPSWESIVFLATKNAHSSGHLCRTSFLSRHPDGVLPRRSLLSRPSHGVSPRAFIFNRPSQGQKLAGMVPKGFRTISEIIKCSQQSMCTWEKDRLTCAGSPQGHKNLFC